MEAGLSTVTIAHTGMNWCPCGEVFLLSDEFTRHQKLCDPVRPAPVFAGMIPGETAPTALSASGKPIQAKQDAPASLPPAKPTPAVPAVTGQPPGRHAAPSASTKQRLWREVVGAPATTEPGSGKGPVHPPMANTGSSTDTATLQGGEWSEAVGRNGKPPAKRRGDNGSLPKQRSPGTSSKYPRADIQSTSEWYEGIIMPKRAGPGDWVPFDATGFGGGPKKPREVYVMYECTSAWCVDLRQSPHGSQWVKRILTASPPARTCSACCKHVTEGGCGDPIMPRFVWQRTSPVPA